MIYVTGDTHGDARRLSQSALSRLREGDTLIVCGDFGFLWDGSAKEEKMLKDLGSRRYNICFIDGTHENFKLLNEYDEDQWAHGKIRRISGNLRYLMRGEVYQLQDKKFFTFGGGESPDMAMRMGTGTWFREEMPNREELRRGMENLRKAGFEVDYIFTHEPMQKTKEFLTPSGGSAALFTALNTYFDEIGRQCRFKQWYFGSMHTDKRVSARETAVFKQIIATE
ncbi:MAG: metallophosphoesterase [Clostridia bacterium]|nr:metallophosphoesterase [Clostridia bacterium]